eukprot:6165815-Prorocentrum_lima.AAC.1
MCIRDSHHHHHHHAPPLYPPPRSKSVPPLPRPPPPPATPPLQITVPQTHPSETEGELFARAWNGDIWRHIAVAPRPAKYSRTKECPLVRMDHT